MSVDMPVGTCSVSGMGDTETLHVKVGKFEAAVKFPVRSPWEIDTAISTLDNLMLQLEHLRVDLLERRDKLGS